MGSLLGGKGANLAEMANINIPVPPGFTISTDVCRYYMKYKKYPAGFKKQVINALQTIEFKINRSHRKLILTSTYFLPNLQIQ